MRTPRHYRENRRTRTEPWETTTIGVGHDVDDDPAKENEKEGLDNLEEQQEGIVSTTQRRETIQENAAKSVTRYKEIRKLEA